MSAISVIVNALSDRLSVCTMHEAARYHAAVRRGGLVSRLSRAGNWRERFATSWITFKPEASKRRSAGCRSRWNVVAVSQRSVARGTIARAL